jgi:hypothetical protein
MAALNSATEIQTQRTVFRQSSTSTSRVLTNQSQQAKSTAQHPPVTDQANKKLKPAVNSSTDDLSKSITFFTSSNSTTTNDQTNSSITITSVATNENTTNVSEMPLERIGNTCFLVGNNYFDLKIKKFVFELIYTDRNKRKKKVCN